MTVRARVYLVRHGETDENRNGIIQGHLDTSLNSVGLEQAQLVGERLRSIPFDIAFSSDLSRAAKTAEAILVHHPNVKVQKQVELRERYMGEMQGKTMQTRQQAGSADNTVESGAFFAARSESWWIKYILDGTALLPDKDEPYLILVTTHGGFIGTLLRSLIHRRKISCATGVVVQRCLNSSVTIIEVDDGRQGVIIQSGDTSHLKDYGKETVENNVDETEVK
ncbi:phosphoglycerate mutase-like protein [Lyophyllum atratum]|nr:phosphoglycerate mutase-like protein [Lyophyllum atratum]